MAITDFLTEPPDRAASARPLDNVLPFRPEEVAFAGWRYRDLFAALGVAVYTTDAAGRITFFNDAAVRLWGRRPELGEEWCGSLRIYRPTGELLPHPECPMAVAMTERRPILGAEAVAERPDGTRVAFAAYPTPLLDAGGELIGAVNVLVDITERRRAEDQLRETLEALRASAAVKDDFLGLVSHELRTPVTTILGNARLLRDRWSGLPDDLKASMVGDIADDSDRLVGIIENLLLLTRVEAGAAPELEPQVLGHVVRATVASFRSRHRGRTITLRQRDGRALVCADGTYLNVLLENLLGNAVKYSASPEPVEITVSVLRAEALVRVADRGIGMTDSEASQLFTPFYRTDAARARASGLGIGLATCRRLVEVLGGSISAAPRRGGGLAVTFTLPVMTEYQAD